MRRLLTILVAVSTILGGTLSPSAAITFGKEVTNGSTAYPSVVSIWTAKDAEALSLAGQEISIIDEEDFLKVTI